MVSSNSAFKDSQIVSDVVPKLCSYTKTLVYPYFIITLCIQSLNNISAVYDECHPYSPKCIENRVELDSRYILNCVVYYSQNKKGE